MQHRAIERRECLSALEPTRPDRVGERGAPEGDDIRVPVVQHVRQAGGITPSEALTFYRRAKSGRQKRFR
jgi:hypothetical protein